MIEIFQSRATLVRIMMGLIIGIVGASMLIYLVPGTGGMTSGSPDAVATVGNYDITSAEINKQLAMIERNGQHISKDMRGLFVRDSLDRLMDQRAIEYEAARMGFQVTDQEMAEQIRQILPMVFTGGSVSSMEAYAAAVQDRMGMSVPEFEDALRNALLEQKLRRLVTDGVTVTDSDIAEEFKRRNEKVKLDYVVLKPQDLESKVSVTDADLAGYFEKNKMRYQIPEKRAFQYALLDIAALRQSEKPSEQSIEGYYKQNIDQYKVQFRVHVEHILFKTTGKTDAEVEEIRKKAEDVLEKAKKGANFEELAKKYSEDDSTKAKGGDLGWIQKGQTVPEFENAAFALQKGQISGLVKSMFGFHIIRCIDREEAHTKTLDEVRGTIVPILQAQMADEQSGGIVDQMAAAVRQSSRTPLDQIAKQFKLEFGTVPPLAAADPLGPLGTANGVRDFLFGAQVGEDSTPLPVDKGTVIVSVTQIQPARAATLAEVRSKVEADYRKEQSVGLAKQRAEELYKRVQGGEKLDVAVKALGLDLQTSELLSQNDSLGGLTPMHKLGPAFTLPVGQVAPPLSQGTNWLVYKAEERQEPNPDDLAKQKADILRQLTVSKQQIAFNAFQEALKNRLAREGKLRVNDQVLKRLVSAG